MSVENTVTVDVETSDGSKVDFDFAFKIFNSDDIKVYKENSDGTYTLLTEVGDWGAAPDPLPGPNTYWVEFDTEAETGTVHLSEANTNGLDVAIIRDSEETQATVFPRTSTYSIKAVENALDKLTLLVQELLTKVNLAAKQPELPVNPDPVEIEAPVDTKGLRWRFDSGANKWYIESTDNDPDDVVEEATTQAEAAAASAVAAAASAVEAVASAADAAASAGTTELTGTLAERPVAPSYNTFYWATDDQQYYRYSVNAGKWFLIG